VFKVDLNSGNIKGESCFGAEYMKRLANIPLVQYPYSEESFDVWLLENTKSKLING
jgi:hypothetical protein